MQTSDAIRLVGMLAATGHGWTDAHVDIYASEIASLSDLEAAEAAVARIIRTWEKPLRVPIATILSEYRRDAERRQNEARVLGKPERIVSREEGVRLAWQEYRRACMMDGKEPNQRLFGSLARFIQ